MELDLFLQELHAWRDDDWDRQRVRLREMRVWTPHVQIQTKDGSNTTCDELSCLQGLHLVVKHF